MVGTGARKIATDAATLTPFDILYDQTDNPSTSGATSQDFEAAYNRYDDQAADDFVVPASGWVVTTVIAPGAYSDGGGPVSSVHVTFYQDSGGLPGSVLCDYPALTTFTGGDTGSLAVTLSPSSCVLQSGAKWVSVQANMDYATGGLWLWTERTITSNSPSVWRNPGGGLGTSCATYTTRTACDVGTDPDQLFQLQGTLCSVDADCQDGNLCNGAETCVGHTCAAGTPVNCDDGQFCTIDTCAAATGLCSHLPDPCGDGDGCTVDSCDNVNGCSHVRVPPIRFCNTASIAIPTAGAGAPYPSNISVTGLDAASSLCSVQLLGITHTYPDDIDVLLVGPVATSQNAEIMSDVGGGTDVSNLNLTLTDAAAASLPDAGPLVAGTFRPTNAGGLDVFPAPAPAATGGSTLETFNGDPNGTWRLYVRDQFPPDSGSMPGGWCLNIVLTHCTSGADCSDADPCNGVEACVDNTCVPGTPINCSDGLICTIDTCTPATGACHHTQDPCDDHNDCTVDSCDSANGCAHANACVQFCNQQSLAVNDGADPPTIATPYPSSIVVSGLGPNSVVGNVKLLGITHSFPDDVDVLLAGPSGGLQNAIIMSDVGGSTAVTGVNLILSDGALVSLPDEGPLVPGTFKPTNVDPGLGTEAWPATAPTPAGGSALSVFTGNLNGTWNLFVVDDQTLDGGAFNGGWCLNLRTLCAIDPDCNDGNPCTTDACAGGVCGHTAVACNNDGNPCTTDVCDPVLGCNFNNTNPCDDGNACTGNDSCAGGACTGTPLPPPAAVTGVTIAKQGAAAAISWSPVTTATTYDVVRGRVGGLPVGPGGGDEVCLSNGQPATSLTDGDDPSSGGSFWYLVRGESACGSGTYGFRSNGTERVTATCN